MHLPSIVAIALITGLVAASCGGTVDGASGSSAECPQVDYCGLRCSGKETPLYPPKCTVPSCPCVPVPARKDWAGTYTRVAQGLPANLVLEPDGTFYWTLDACEFSGGECGQWMKSQPHTITLLPASGASTLKWLGNEDIFDVEELRMVDSQGDLVVDIPSPGAKPSAQRWAKGHMCAICTSGGLAQEACDGTPVEKRCGR